MKKQTKNWTIGLLCAFPLILIAEFLSFSFIMGMLREKSDMSVLIGVTSIGVFLFLNFLLVKLILTKTNLL